MSGTLLHTQPADQLFGDLRRLERLSGSETKPPRVIHVVDSLDKTSVEVWLLRMLEHSRKRAVPIDWTFYCILGGGILDEQARALGAQVVCPPVPIGDKFAFARAFRLHLRLNRYDVLHSHHDLVSAVYFLAALRLPIKRRIVHIHNADESVLTPSVIKQAIYRPSLRYACLMLADEIVANSNHSLDTFLAGRKRRAGRDVVHYCGIDQEPLVKARPDRAALRRQCGFEENARIVLFAGRIVPEKNPVFAVDVIAEMRRLDARVVGLFAGSGSLENDVLVRAAALGVGSHIKCLGWRTDTAQLMAACDWFILPHPEDPMEGFGVAVVEAQLAGLRLLLSTGVADDPLLPTAAVSRLPLACGVKEWAAAALQLWAGPAPTQDATLDAFRRSPMSMDYALRDLMHLHGQ